MADSYFALDVGEKYIKIADVSKSGSLLTAKTFAYDQAFANFFITEGERQAKELASTIQKLVSDGGIKKKTVNIIIPDTHSYSRIIEMPLLTEKELVSAIKYQADQFIPIPIDKVSLDIEILNTDKKNKKLFILIVASPTSVIDKVLQTVESAGLLPDSVENETSAVLRLISATTQLQLKKNNPSKLVLFINFGFTSTSLYLYDVGLDIPKDLHNFELGVDIFVRSIRANLNKNDEEIKKLLETTGFATDSSVNLAEILSSSYNEIVAEIEKFVVSAKSKFNVTIDSCYLFGEGFKTHGICEKLTTSLGIKTSLYDLVALFQKNNVVDFFKNDLPIFAPTIGGNLR